MELTGEFMTNVELVKNKNWYYSAIDDVQMERVVEKRMVFLEPTSILCFPDVSHSLDHLEILQWYYFKSINFK